MIMKMLKKLLRALFLDWWRTRQKPLEEARNVVAGLKSSIEEAEQLAAGIMMRETELIHQKKHAQAKQHEFEDMARKELMKNNEGLATELVERSMAYEQRAADIQIEIDAVEPQSTAMKNQLNELRKVHQKAVRELSMLETQYAMSKASMKATKLSFEMKDRTAGGHMADAKAMVEKLRCEADAAKEVFQSDDDRLAAKLAALNAGVGGDDVKSRLDKLRQKKVA
jgi:phage shock protein A